MSSLTIFLQPVLPIARIFFHVLAILLIFACPPVLSHGLVGDRLNDVNHALEHNPADAGLYLNRGRIYQEKQHWDKALADYERAQQLDKNLHEVLYWLGRLYLERQNYTVAEQYLHTYISRSDSPQGHTALAELYEQTEKNELAAKHHSKAIQLDSTPPPALFFKRARVLMQMPTKWEHEIVAGIHEGMARHGELIIYCELLIDFYSQKGAYANALESFARLPERLQATPLWQQKKADLLAKAGNKELAIKTYRATITAWEQMPAHKRNVKANMEVKQEAELALARLLVKEPSPLHK